MINLGLISLFCYSWDRSNLLLSNLPFIQRLVHMANTNPELACFDPEMGYSMHVLVPAGGGQVALEGRKKNGLGG